MSVVLSIAEINLLLSTKTAQENYVYVCEDGFLYKCQKNGQVQRLLNTNYDDWVRQRNSNQTLPYRNKTIEQGTRQSDGDITDVKVNDSGVMLGGGSAVIDLEKLKIRIPPTLTITVGARVTSGAASNVTAAFNYYEDL